LVTGSECVGVLSGLVYAISPQFAQVDNWFVYEPFGLSLFIWSLVLLLWASRERGRRAAVLYLASAFPASASVVTHHITGGMLVVGSALITLGWYLDRNRHRARELPPIVYSVLLACAFVAWSIWRKAELIAYLGPPLEYGVETVWHLVIGTSASAGHGALASRTPFVAAGAIPAYEQAATYLVQPILLVATAYCIFRWRRRLNAGTCLVLGFAFSYFLLLPLILTSYGSEVAHRSWAFAYFGLSVVLGVAADALLKRLAASTRSGTRSVTRSVLHTGARGCIACLAIVVVIGSYGAAVNYIEMFPGRFVFQSDGRDSPQELVNVAEWMNVHGGHGAAFAADYRSSVLIAAYTLGTPEDALADEIIAPTTSPSPSVVLQAKTTLKFVVVDRRLTTDLSATYYFGPAVPLGPEPLPKQSLAKLLHLPWLRLVYSTLHYDVYRVLP
jgi:hypothetical protein